MLSFFNYNEAFVNLCLITVKFVTKKLNNLNLLAWKTNKIKISGIKKPRKVYINLCFLKSSIKSKSVKCFETKFKYDYLKTKIYVKFESLLIWKVKLSTKTN